MNQLPWEKRASLKRLLAAGVSHRNICATLPCGKATVVRYARLWRLAAHCPCGGPAGHKGWCQARFMFSTKRRGWMAEQWAKRGDNELTLIVDTARAVAASLKHRLGPFLWSAPSTTAIAYALCTVCGKMVRIHNAGAAERFDGTAVRDRCFTNAQRAAQKAAHQEKREWRNAKRQLVSLKRALRDPSRLPAMASSLAVTSPPSSQP